MREITVLDRVWRLSLAWLTLHYLHHNQSESCSSYYYQGELHHLSSLRGLGSLLLLVELLDGLDLLLQLHPPANSELKSGD